MAYIDKILIKGIRSFDPGNESSLKFDRPLTLIVGSNGAGKTTIIECLRMACTGTLPPSSRAGQSFVHDPKLANKTEIKAQIRMKFSKSEEDVFVVVRSFQLTQRAASMQFRAIDQTLKREDKNSGKMTAITHTCADMDKIIPSLMGIPKAILDNVIFVHQDEANWPLAEGKVLKEKFDLLFDTSKYTKWFDEMKKLKTEKSQELKLKIIQVEHCKKYKDLAADKKKKISTMKAESIAIEAQIAGLKEQITVAEGQVRVVESTVREILKEEGSLVVLKSSLELSKKHKQELAAKLGDDSFDESDEELTSHAKHCDDEIQTKQKEIHNLDNTLKTTQLDSSALEEQYCKLCLKHGKLQAEVESFVKSEQEVEALCQKIKQDGLVDDYSDVEIAQSQLEHRVDAQEAELAEMKYKNREEEEIVSQRVQELSVGIQLMTEKAANLSLELHQTQYQLTTNHGKIHSLEEDKGLRMEELRTEERTVQSQLEEKKVFQENEKFGAVIEEISTEMKAIDQCLKKLREEKVELKDQAESSTEIKLKAQELESKKNQLNGLMISYRSQILTILAQDVLPHGLKQAYEEALASKKENLLRAEETTKQLTAEEMLMKREIESIRKEKSHKESAFLTAKDTLEIGLYGVLGKDSPVEDFEAYLTEQEQSFNECLEEVSLVQSQLTVLQNELEKATNDNNCPSCQRPFDSQEQQKFIQKKRQQLEDLPTELSQKQELLKELEEKRKALKKLQPIWMEYKDFKETGHPQLQAQEKELQSKLQDTTSKVQCAHSVLRKAQGDLKKTEKLLEAVVWPVGKLLKEVETDEESLKSLELNLLVKSSLGKTLIEVEKEIESLESERNVKEQRKDELQRTQQQLNVSLMKLSEEHRKIQDQINQISSEMQQCDHLSQQMEGLEVKRDEMQGSLGGLRAELETLNLQQEKAKVQQRSLKVKNSEQETGAENQLRVAQQLKQDFEQRLRTHKESKDRSPMVRFDQVKTELEEIRKRQEKLQKLVKETENRRREAMDEIQQFSDLKRSIHDYMDWRKAQKEEEKYLKQISQSESTLFQLGDKLKIENRLKKKQSDLEKLKNDRSRLDGSLFALQQSIVENEKDFESREFENCEKEYKAALIDKVLLELGILDLTKLIKASEKALLTYHSMKMEEVNTIIRELWRSIYCGVDIDYIEIKADSESGPSNRSSYNYWVSMVTNGTELEMRGKCSAGQKVLAGIIVRLALAETFCSQCGILALDEPTTNLDKENIDSLADALRELIDLRGQQNNFQLIVITHDDEFAKRLQSRNYAEFMWRVTKDEKRHTILSKERL